MIYCVEDDRNLRELALYALKSSGFDAHGFETAKEFWQAMGTEKPDLVLLDIMLPDDDGLSILKRLRDNPDTRRLPIIMATAKGTEYDKVMGLESGADDYLVKPFGMMEMISRIRAVLRRVGIHEEDPQLCLGEMILDTRKHTVTIGHQQIELTMKEYSLLKLFMNNLGRAFTRDQLLSSVWGEEYFGETRTVDVHISTLRAKLGSYGKFIKTVRGLGYRMEEDQ
ncbi:MAG: response regulator transcription factor [Christensenellales bacterium]|nr:response regulator transcription factor [Clostridiales bacterium]